MVDIKPRGQKRVHLETQVNLEFERFSGFITEFSGNLSEGGMFIKTESPQPVGSLFSFEFRLKDAVKLIQGWGEVVWICEPHDADDNHPAGMGVKFVDLDEESRQFIRRIVQTEKESNMVKNQPGGSDGRSPGGLHDLLNDSSLFDESALDAPTEVIQASNPGAEPMQEISNVGNSAVEEIGMQLSDDGEAIIMDDGQEVQPSRSYGKWIFLLLLLGAGGAGYWYRTQVIDVVNMALYSFGLKQITIAKVATTPAAPPATPVTTDAAPAVVNHAAPVAPAAPIAAATPLSTPVPVFPPATQVAAVRLLRFDAQQSVFAIELNGAMPKERVELFMTPEPPPRLVVDLPGITQGFNKQAMLMKDNKVKKIRFGWNQQSSKMRIVFDLAAAKEWQSELTVNGKTLEISVKRP